MNQGFRSIETVLVVREYRENISIFARGNVMVVSEVANIVIGARAENNSFCYSDSFDSHENTGEFINSKDPLLYLGSPISNS